LKPHFIFKNNITLEQTIKAARQIEENNDAYFEALTEFYSTNINSVSAIINYNYSASNNSISAIINYNHSA
ncbi:22928_t:CDS:1, partial [Cetraspora pellucida]